MGLFICIYKVILSNQLVCTTTHGLHNIIFTNFAGFLSQVSNATIVQFNITTLKLSFSAPFTLENVSILYYIIEIRDEDTSDVMIKNTTSLISLINIKDYCNKYMIYITPWNGLGGGETSIISDVIFYKSKYKYIYINFIKIIII